MNAVLDETHDPQLKSWVDSANQTGADFPIQNLPLGVFERSGSDRGPRVGTAIGESIFDISAGAEAGLLDAAEPAVAACRHDCLNELMSLGPHHWQGLRRALSRVLSRDNGDRALPLGDRILVPRDGARLHVPAAIGDYTDFYASIFHATAIGRIFRPDNPLLPNYKYVPIGYHGRSSSIVASGEGIRRPQGQTRPDDRQPPVFGPSRLFDYELEVGFFVGPGNALGEAIAIEYAEDHILGLCLVNDWSARDIQKWEYQPLGPFLAKSFATTVSPWVVTLQALAPFRVHAFQRANEDPAPMPYLSSDADSEKGAIDLTLEVSLRTSSMRDSGLPAQRLSRGTFSQMYWTVAQLLTHHSSNGCNLRPGDLMASGTVSGPEPGSQGCLMELTRRGQEPIQLPNGETRAFLEEGDEVVISGYCEREGAVRIGFGECRGTIL